MTNQLTKINSDNFYGSSADFYQDENNDIYMTIEQVANCLGYKSRKGIEMLFTRNPHLNDKDLAVAHAALAEDGKSYNTKFITEEGLYEICFLSTKPKALDFHRWFRKMLKGLRKQELTIHHHNSTSHITNIDLDHLESRILKQLKRQESLIYTLIPKQPYNAWKSQMTVRINEIVDKYDIEFKTILRQIYSIMQTDYDIPLAQYMQDWIIQNPDLNPSMYETIVDHTEIHDLFEKLVYNYEEVVMPVATST